MDERQLFHMYQSWQQGQDDYVRDWYHFVDWAAKWHQTSGDKVMRILQTTYWFRRPKDESSF